MSRKMTYTQQCLVESSSYKDGSFSLPEYGIPKPTAQDMPTYSIKTEYKLPSPKERRVYSGIPVAIGVIEVINQNSWYFKQFYMGLRYQDKFNDYKSAIEEFLSINADPIQESRIIEVILTFENGSMKDAKVFDSDQKYFRETNESYDYKVLIKSNAPAEKIKKITRFNESQKTS